MKIRTIPGNAYRLDLPSRAMGRVMRLARKTGIMPSQTAYNVTISHERKFLWFRVAKVGTRSILAALNDADVTLDAEHPLSIHYPLNRYEDYFKFAFVRNPWDRLVSCWHNKIVDRHRASEEGVVRWNHLSDERLEELADFDKFVEWVSGKQLETCDLHLRLQSKLIDLDQIDYLGRFETLQADVAEVFERIGVPAQELQRKNASVGRRDFREYYDDALAERVFSIYRKDIQIFNYQF